jgi:hypothetical protein
MTQNLSFLRFSILAFWVSSSVFNVLLTQLECSTVVSFQSHVLHVWIEKTALVSNRLFHARAYATHERLSENESDTKTVADTSRQYSVFDFGYLTSDLLLCLEFFQEKPVLMPALTNSNLLSNEMFLSWNSSIITFSCYLQT